MALQPGLCRTWSETQKTWLRVNCTIYVAKTKALNSFAVTVKLICVFVFAYAKCWFSNDAAQIVGFIRQPLSLHRVVVKCWFSHDAAQISFPYKTCLAVSVGQGAAHIKFNTIGMELSRIKVAAF